MKVIKYYDSSFIQTHSQPAAMMHQPIDPLSFLSLFLLYAGEKNLLFDSLPRCRQIKSTYTVGGNDHERITKKNPSDQSELIRRDYI